jgi:hypothetical protein
VNAERALAATACALVLAAAGHMAAGTQAVPPTSMTITLTGQSMIRSDVRATAAKAVPVMAGLL